MSTRTLIRMLSAVLLICTIGSSHAQGQGLKLYISVDMEGVVGAVTGDHLGPGGFEYQLTRKFMTEEVLAAIGAAREMGVTEFLVSDSHGNGENLLIEMLPEDVMVVRSWPRPLMMMEGIDSTFDAAIFLGYHAGTTNPQGVRAHTISSGRLADVRLNDRSMLEAGINAAIAGHFGVPVIMISGDDATIEEARAIIGDIEGAVVKWNYSFHSAKTLTPAAAYKLIGEKVKAAILRIDEFEPLVLPSPVTLDVRFKNYRPSQVLDYLSIVERTDAHSIRFVGSDMIEISKFLEFLVSYNAGLEP
ncbi:MAG: M55 family metallopeptidase [Gemmatimonadota bacterium]|nr:MAG: M55 family metallopeptidase [Gemmatimonadota bacterium]